MMTDPISDMLTRIRNASKELKETTSVPYSKLKENIISILASEGFIRGFEVVGESRKDIVVYLKYTPRKEKVITEITRVSKPGKRVYVSVDKMRPVKNGFGVAIISTPKGVMSDKSAREQHIGGEWLCTVS